MIHYITKQTKIDPMFKTCSVNDMLLYFKDHVDIEVDTETEGWFDFTNKVICCQFGDPLNQYVVNFAELSQDEKNSINNEILNNPKKTKILQNAKFDIKFFWFHGFEIVNIYDTMLAEVILNAGKDNQKTIDSETKESYGFYSLYSMVYRYCGIRLDKETRGLISKYGLTDRVILYAANDVKYLTIIKNKQLVKLKELGLANEDHQDIYTVCGLEMNAIFAFAALEYNGIKLNVDKWRKVQILVEDEVNTVKKEIDKIIWEEPKLKKFQDVYQDLFTPAHETSLVNWASPQQKLKVLQTLFPEIKSTGADILAKYKLQHPIFGKLIEYSKAIKLKTSFADTMIGHMNPVTKRIHTDFWQILETGRVSSSKPNMQQIPSRTELGGKMRECFVPEKGHKMVGGDYSGCELRIIAEGSQDPVWMNAFKEGKDLHSELCAMTFGIDIKDVKTFTPFKPDLKYRDVQKTLNFGLAYGMSEYKLSDTVEISTDEAKRIIKKFFKAVPKVEKFLNILGYLGKSRGYIKTAQPYGRYRWFDGWDSGDKKRLGEIERAAKNHPIQGGNADMTKLALVMLYDEIKKNNYPVKLVHQVHDEIQTEVTEEFAEEWATIMEDIMVKAASVVLKQVPMVVDCKVAEYWSK